MTPTRNKNRNDKTDMKTSTIAKTLLAAVLLSGTGTVLLAQTPAPACPLGQAPGYGRTLDATQRAEHRAAMETYVAGLRQKEAQGTLTADEQAWLQQAAQQGSPCVTGASRGPGAGKGCGVGQGNGQRQRRGLCDGTGPRNAGGTCPNGQAGQRGGRR
jgi:hypothetical protein